MIDFANRLANNNHYASEKILEKAHDIDERYSNATQLPESVYQISGWTVWYNISVVMIRV